MGDALRLRCAGVLSKIDVGGLVACFRAGVWVFYSRERAMGLCFDEDFYRQRRLFWLVGRCCCCC